MDKTKFSKFFKDIGNGLSKHSPEILTGIGIAGMLTTTVLAVKATPKALKKIEEAKDGGEDRCEKLPVKTVVKVTWKCYVPAAVTGVASVACLIGASSIHLKRNAALATAYQISTNALREYKTAVVETVGEETEKAIHDKIAEKKLNENPIEQKEVIITGNGEFLCYDMHSGRPFKSSRNKIEKAVNTLNWRMTTGMEMSISLNEYYGAIGLPTIPVGDTIGWRIDKGQIEIHYGSMITDNDEPCITVEFLVPPEYGFNKMY